MPPSSLLACYSIHMKWRHHNTPIITPLDVEWVINVRSTLHTIWETWSWVAYSKPQVLLTLLDLSEKLMLSRATAQYPLILHLWVCWKIPLKETLTKYIYPYCCCCLAPKHDIYVVVEYYMKNKNGVFFFRSRYCKWCKIKDILPERSTLSSQNCIFSYILMF